nr:immunoglobulin heavy chain junction region [Mus musculus]MBK4188518.1 immunoglobulin heavy chain junction region [Mus musculus]
CARTTNWDAGNYW